MSMQRIMVSRHPSIHARVSRSLLEAHYAKPEIHPQA
jgi:hypothetical protein